jgi:prepilin-type N-terminal cleavage/methylation domain-containing protein
MRAIRHVRRVTASRSAREGAATNDPGFTLIECVMALLLLTLVAAGTAPLFIRSVTSSQQIQRRQVAAEVAQQQMDIIRSVQPTIGSTTSNLILNRQKSAVDAQWAQTSTADLSQTNEVWDPNATSSSPAPVVPITTTTTIAGIPYTVNNYIGTCYLPAAGGACVKTSVAGSDMIYRAIVDVKWNPGYNQTCASGGCEYVQSTLIDPSSDPQFNSNQ